MLSVNGKRRSKTGNPTGGVLMSMNGGTRVGVYICHCGGNISDYVDVEKVREAVAGEPGVVIKLGLFFRFND